MSPRAWRSALLYGGGFYLIVGGFVALVRWLA